MNVAQQLAENASKIDAELLAAQGKPVDIGRLLPAGSKKTAAAMRPSPTLNALVAALA